MRFGTKRQILTFLFVPILLVVGLLFLDRSLSAQTGGQYDLSWSTIGGGGEIFSTGSQYVLGATIGAYGAGRSSGGNYQLESGFWHCFLFAFPGCEAEEPKAIQYLPMITISDS